MTRMSLDELESPLPEAGPPADRQLDGPADQPAGSAADHLADRPLGHLGQCGHAGRLGLRISGGRRAGLGLACGWIVAAGLLQLWYLLDHVDGQLARLRGTASLDGVQLDFLMHHTVNLLVPLGAVGDWPCVAWSRCGFWREWSGESRNCSSLSSTTPVTRPSTAV